MTNQQSSQSSEVENATKSTLGQAEGYTLTTKHLAGAVNVRPQTITRRYWATGSYFGEVPKKGLNRHLWWLSGAPGRLKNE